MSRAFDRALIQAALIARLADSNLLVNGFHTVSQENGSTAASIGKYPVDQFSTSGPNNLISAQQVANPFPSQPDIPFGTKVTVSTAQATMAAADQYQIYQSIEGTNLARLQYGAANARPVTLAFMLRPNFSGVAYFSLISLANTSNYRSVVHKLALVANQDNFFCFTVSGDQAAALLTSTAASLQVRWCFAAGTQFQTPNVDVWQTGNFQAGADITNMVATVGNSVIISGCVMVPGRFNITQDVLPMLQRRYDDELRLCQRYYFLDYGRWDGQATQGAGVTTVSKFAVAMRTNPSITYATAGVANFNPTPGVYSVTQHALWSGQGPTASGGAYFTFYYYANARM